MINADLHTHTNFSSDSEALPEEMVEGAVSKGLKTLCITDHYDYLYPEKIEGGFVFEIEAYERRMTELREKCKGRLKLNIGIELGLRNEPELRGEVRDHYAKIVNGFDFDFIIGSTHVVASKDPYNKSFWEMGISKERGLNMYFESIAHNIPYYDTLFDSYGHIDYIIRYVPDGVRDYSVADYRDITDEILKLLIKHGRALECNTAGLKYGLGFAHPKEEILKRYLELGGELLTIGSDAHEPKHLAYDFDKVRDYLKNMGVKYYTVYEGRKPEQYSL